MPELPTDLEMAWTGASNVLIVHASSISINIICDFTTC